MPKVTGILDSKANFSLFSVYVDDKYLADLSVFSIDKFGLKIGSEIDDRLSSQLKDSSSVDIFYMRSLKLISIRKRSKKEISDFLTKNQLSRDLIEEVISRLIDKNYLNDEEFAKSFINDRMLLNPVSYRKLVYLLKTKGISEEVVSKIVSKEEVNQQSLAKIVAKKRKISRFNDDKKLTNYLLSQGFSYSDIKQFLENENL